MPHTLPIPADFPVQWADPNDAQSLWQYHSTYYSAPHTPLEFEIYMQRVSEGFKIENPFFLCRCLRLNGYFYETYLFHETPSENIETLYETTISPMLATLADKWEHEYFPVIRQELTRWETFDVQHATLMELVAHLDETMARNTTLFSFHDRLVCPAILAMSQFEDLYHDLFGAEEDGKLHQLLHDLETHSLKSARDLWRLSRQARNMPVVRNILLETPVADVLAELAASDEGQTFLAGFNAYLRDYGKNNQHLFYLTSPSWREDPTPVIQNLKNYAAQPERDFSAENEQSKHARAQALAECRARLADYPQPVIEKFEFLLRVAQVGTFLYDEHVYWIEIPTMYHTRQLVLALGQRLTETGVIQQGDDVFYLTCAEIRQSASTPGTALHAIVTERRAEMARFATLTPPPMLGTLPDENASAPINPFLESFMRLLGIPLPPSEEPDTLRGYAGSAGIVTGPVKILQRPDEAEKLRPGDILVTNTTTPVWTPLFASVAGLITDAGGVLGHSAVVAREFGIPAVVGTGQATSILKDGQIVELNGNTGQVRMSKNQGGQA